ncbi:IMP 5'-nucleotidase [Coemansia sp. RSA 552]|nr:IMP 5'-nucleotidase [Coemansia sp. RSA 552]
MTSQYRANYHLRAHKRDELIEFIKAMLLTPFVLGRGEGHSEPLAGQQLDTPVSQRPDPLAGRPQDATAPPGGLSDYAAVFGRIEAMVDEHRRAPAQSQLARLVPGVGTFFTRLPLRAAFARVDAREGISARRHVAPSFNDVRRILNTAQVMAVAAQAQLVTFDGDMTLYADGADFGAGALAAQLIGLLRRGIWVGVVTAAGYGDAPERYEQRLAGLLHALAAAQLEPAALERFFVLGGECNFLFRCDASARLRFQPGASFEPAWTDSRVQSLLDVAQEALNSCVRRMSLPAAVVRKPRAVGLVPRRRLTREQLDECALAAQAALLRAQGVPSAAPGDAPVPFCAFNGGADCWVDIGNKLVGVQLLQRLAAVPSYATLHVGDQFLSTGNDFATRAACCTCWIIDPEETQGLLEELEELLDQEGRPVASVDV